MYNYKLAFYIGAMIRLLVFLVLSFFSAQVFATTGTYNLFNSFVMQSCFGPPQPDDWGSYYLGPSDDQGACLSDPSKKCNIDQQFAVFPRGIRALKSVKNICSDMGMNSCELLQVSVVNTEGDDKLVIHRISVKNSLPIINEIKEFDIAKVLNIDAKFILPYDSCNYFEVKFKIVPLL